MTMRQSRYQNSLHLWEKSKMHVIPGSSTISKRADLYPYGAYPVYLESAEGAMVHDIDGNPYVDFQSALGAVLLGFGQPAVTDAMMTQLVKGNLFSLSHPSVIKLAEGLKRHIPCAERVRILKNGSDATTGAVRIARAFTGREKILACHYHGWHDWYYVSTNLNAGIPTSLKENIITFPYGDLERFEELVKKHEGQIAAVIMEPVHLDPPPEGYLEKIRAITEKHGIILIFDEVVTGFRFGNGGAQTFFKVTPDLACFAKALGNGAPISALVGTKDMMEATQQVVTTQTYGEDCLAIAAALATLEMTEKEPVSNTLWERGTQLQQGYNLLAEKWNLPTTCAGYPVRLQLTFKDHGDLSARFLRNYILQETAKDGFLIAHMIFVNYAHTENHVNSLLGSIERIFRDIATMPSHRLILSGSMATDLW